MRGMWATLLLLAAPTLAPAESWSVDRLPFPLDSGWLFRRGHDPAWSSPFREKTHWQPIRVTGPWERQGFGGYNGHAWYRLTFQLPSRFAAESLGVDLGTLGDVDEVFLNGQRIGSSGSFPPLYEPATLKRRIYRLPRVSLRYGEFNELSVHVYNEGRFGGFLGPPPVLDRYETLLARQTGRDVVLWVGAAFLAVLALFHGALSLFYGGGKEQWAWVTFLLTFAGYQITYASFGPSLWWGSGVAFRLNVIALLLAVGTFALVVASQTRGPIPTPAVVFASVMGVGAGFAALWRRSVDLYLWVYFAELAIGALVVFSLWLFARKDRSPRRWTLVLASLPFFAMVIVDVAVDLCLLPRPGRGLLLLYSSLGVVPFALAMSVTLTTRWAQQRAGSFLPHLGLLPWDTFAFEVRRRLSIPNPPPLAVALMRVTTVSGAPMEVEAVANYLRKHIRHCDLLGRYGRETVAILMEDMDEREALAFVERVRRALRQMPGPTSLRPTAGLAAFRSGRYASAEELLRACEAALYAARSEGGDCTATAP